MQPSESSFFISLPWMSNFIVEDLQAIRSGFSSSAESKFLPLLDGLMKYRDTIATSETLSTPNSYFSKWVKGTLDETDVPQGLHVSGRAQVLSVMMAYRVLETAHMVYDSSFTTRVSNCVNPSQPPDVVKLIQHLKKQIRINGERLDWVGFLQKAKENAEMVWEKNTIEDESQAASTGTRLLRSVIQKSKKAHGYALLANIETAAAYLLYVISKGSVDIFDMTDVIANLNIPQESATSVKKNLPKASFQEPLFLALAVSPLWLLMDSLIFGTLFMKTGTKSCLLNSWLCSPIIRSEEFIKVEIRLWRAIFDIAEGKPTKIALGNFFESLNFQELSAAAPDEKTCFVEVEVDSENKGPASPRIKELDTPEANRFLSLVSSLIPEATSSSRKRMHHGEDSSAVGESQSKKMRADLESTREQENEPANGAFSIANVEEDEHVPSEDTFDADSQLQGNAEVSNLQVSVAIVDEDEHVPLESIFDADSQLLGNAVLNQQVSVANVDEEEHGLSEDIFDADSQLLGNAVLNQQVSVSNVDEDEHVPSEVTFDAYSQLLGNAASNQQGKVNHKNRDKPRGKMAGTKNRVSAALIVGVDKGPHRVNVKAEEEDIRHPGLLSISSYQALCNDKKDWPNVEARDLCGVQRIQGQKSINYPVPGSPNEEFLYQPEAHLEKELSWLYSLENQTLKSHPNSIPMYAASLDCSCLSIMSGKDWNKLSHLQRQKLFSTKDILILGSEIEEVGFDRDFLLSVAGSMDRVVTVQDHSSDELDGKFFSGKMDALYRHSQDSNGLVLSALDLPTTEAFHPGRSLSTDVCAFLATMGKQYCNKNCHQYPQRSMHWNDCTLKHANSRFNISPNGFVKYKRVICGAELLFIATLVKEVGVGDIDIFSAENYDKDLPPGTRWIVEAVPILPGSTIYIRPCRPHAVVALRHTVCQGGYLYSWSTIKDTCFGILHDFGTGLFFSSTERIWDSRELIRRIITYFHMHFIEGGSQSDGYHLPDMSDFQEVVSLLCLLNVAILGHLIYLPFYQEKVSLFDSSHQILFSVTRQKAEAILGYMDRKVLFRKDGQELEFKPLFRTFFVQQVRSLIRQCSTWQPEYTTIAQGGKVNLQKLTEAVAASFHEKSWFVKEMERQRKINYPDTSYAWISDEVIVTSVRNASSEDSLKKSRSFHLEFPLDLAYDDRNMKMRSLFDILQHHQKLF